MTIKDIVGYEGLYAITEEGKIWSYPKKTSKGKWLKNTLKSNSYLWVGLYKNGKMKSCRVHRLVALTYLEEISNKSQINHKNGIKIDNRTENLEWCNASENTKHAHKLGLISFTENHLKAAKINAFKMSQKKRLLSQEDASNIRKLKDDGHKISDLSAKYNVSRQIIANIIYFKSYRR